MRGSMRYFYRQHKRSVHAVSLIRPYRNGHDTSVLFVLVRRRRDLLPIEVRIGLEFCQHFLILVRRIIATIHLEEVGGGVDIGCGIFVALGNDPPIRVNAFEYNAYRWHSSFSFHFYGGMAKSHTTVVPSSMSYALYHTSLTLLS